MPKKPAYYEEIKNLTEEQMARSANMRHLHDFREHMEVDHGAAPEEYGDDVLGWHKKHWPLCNFVKEYYEKYRESLRNALLE